MKKLLIPSVLILAIMLTGCGSTVGISHPDYGSASVTVPKKYDGKQVVR